VLDKNQRISRESNIFGKHGRTLIVSDKTSQSFDNSLSIDFSENIAVQLCRAMHQQGMQSVIIEGGRQTLQTFINEGLWDEARVFTGKSNFGNGISAPILQVGPSQTMQIDGDELKTYWNEAQIGSL
jgi:diaminohydroxyphosphoribosylaminopyrimidine deaminase/5-amino-6-(5-phosphoribosylamino)uracil reductase